MKKLLFGLFLIPTLCLGQKGYVGVEPAIYFYSGAHAIGAHMSVNGKLGTGMFAGIQFGVLKFQDLSKVYIPIQAKFSVIPKKTPCPMVTIEPGYGIYKNYMAAGGFTFYGGAGIAFPASKGGRGFLTIGYSNFGFQVGEVLANTEAFGIRFGFMIY